MLTSQWHALLNVACFLILRNISEIKTPSPPIVTLQGWWCLSQSFCTKWRFILSSNLLLSLAGGGLNEDNYEKKRLSSAGLCRSHGRVSASNRKRRLCSADSLRGLCRHTGFRLRGSGGRRFLTACCSPGGYHTQIPSRSTDALTTFSIIRRSLALSVWILAPKSNVTCVITTQSRVQLISVCDEERVDIIPRSLISGKTTKIGHFVAFVHETGGFCRVGPIL